MKGRSSIAKATAALVLLWLYVPGCSLNPQPEPPGDNVGVGGSSPDPQGGSSGTAGAGQAGSIDAPGGNGVAGGSGGSSGSDTSGGNAGEGASSGFSGTAGVGGESGGESGEAGVGGEAGSAGEGGSGGGVLSECQEYAIALCHKLNECEPFAFKLAYGDLIACAARENVVCVRRVNADDSGLENGQVLGCGQALMDASCEDFLTGSIGGACAPEAGQRPLDASCGDHSQCESTFCKYSGNCGICAPVPGAGDACESNDQCAPGQACSDAGVCALYAQLGQDCAATRCVPTLSCKKGTCQAPSAIGEPCSTNGDCDTLGGVVCFEQVCTQTLVVHEGSACGSSASAPTTCDVNSSCVTDGEQDVCEKKLADEELCTEGGPSCLAAAHCYNGICLLEDPMLCK